LPSAVDLAGVCALHTSVARPANGSCSSESDGEERVMPAPVSRPLAQPRRFGKLWWLPSGGISNGIEDDAWAPILDVTADLVEPLLAALREAGAPGYAAAVTRRRAPRRHAGAESGYRLWVGSSAHGRAEETLIRALGRLGGGGRGAAAGRRPERVSG
jgi:hypothetical protein